MTRFESESEDDDYYDMPFDGSPFDEEFNDAALEDYPDEDDELPDEDTEEV